jgi:hypothetical protein
MLSWMCGMFFTKTEIAPSYQSKSWDHYITSPSLLCKLNHVAGEVAAGWPRGKIRKKREKIKGNMEK